MATTGARSIAKDISRREPPEAPDGEHSQAHEEQDSQADEQQPYFDRDEETDSQSDDEQPALEADEQSVPQAAEEQPNPEAKQSDARADEEQSDFEANMYELQAGLGEEWTLHFSVHGDDGWLTAERQDGTQRVEAPDAQRLVTIVDAIDECGGRQP
jgi:hypothetical protein